MGNTCAYNFLTKQYNRRAEKLQVLHATEVKEQYRFLCEI